MIIGENLMKRKLQPGDVVRRFYSDSEPLGQTKMTIESVTHSTVMCVWFRNDGMLYRHSFKPKMLVIF
jgi:uncharacterized protein YodC (DUF2158 family)